MSVQSMRDLLGHDLQGMRDAEHRVGRLIGQIANEMVDGQAKILLRQGANNAKQIANVEECLRILNLSPGGVICAVLQGFEQEHQAFTDQQPGAAALMIFDLDLTEKIKQFEITAYRLLISKANLLGLPECQQLLIENQRGEEDIAHQIERLDFLLTRQLIQSLGQTQSRRA